MIIDEIGKMELFSQKFRTVVQNYYKKGDTLVLATIPLRKTQIPLVEDIRVSHEIKLFTVSIFRS